VSPGRGNRFEARAGGQKQRLPHRYLENLDGILAIQSYLLEQADRFGVPTIDNVSFDASVRMIIDEVTAALRRREAAEGGAARAHLDPAADAQDVPDGDASVG
jgi:2-phosphoglycerate kinase